VHVPSLKLDVQGLAEALHKCLGCRIGCHERNALSGPHGSAQHEPSAAAASETISEQVRDIQMRERIEAEPLELLAVVFLQKPARLAGTRIGDHQPQIQIDDGSPKIIDGAFLREVGDDTARFDAESLAQLPAKLIEKGLAPCRQDNIETLGSELPCELRTNA